MVKPNPADLRRQNKYQDSSSTSDIDTKETNSHVMKCEDCPGNGRFWIIPESYQIIKYTNFFTGEMHFHEGKFFIKFPWRTHIEIFDLRPKLINPSIKQFRTSDGDIVDADFSLEYKIIDRKNYIMNFLSFDAKLTERIQSIMQQHFRNHDAASIATTSISMKTVNEKAFKQIEKDLGIMILSFNKTTLNLQNYDKEKNNRQQKLMQIETHKATLEGEMDIQDMQRQLELFAGQTKNMVLQQKLSVISEIIENFPIEQQAGLLKSILEIIEISTHSDNINYFTGAGLDSIINSLNNGKKR